MYVYDVYIVCMYVCMYVWSFYKILYVYIYVRMNECMYVCMYVCMYTSCMNNSSFVFDYKGGGETCGASKRAGPDVLDVYMCSRGDYNFVSSNYCNGDALMIFY